MRVEIDLDQLAANIPVQGYVVAGVVAYYFSTGLLFRLIRSRDWDWLDELSDLLARPPAVGVWILSPLVVVLVALALVVWPTLWAVSGGLVPPPWRKSVWA